MDSTRFLSLDVLLLSALRSCKALLSGQKSELYQHHPEQLYRSNPNRKYQKPHLMLNNTDLTVFPFRQTQWNMDNPKNILSLYRSTYRSKRLLIPFTKPRKIAFDIINLLSKDFTKMLVKPITGSLIAEQQYFK